MKRRRQNQFQKHPVRNDSGRGASFEVRETPDCRAVLAGWRQQRDDGALQRWDDLSRKESSNLRSLGLAARAFGERFRFEKTAELVGQMEKLDPSSPLVHQAVGDVWRASGQIPAALASYEKALKCARAPESLLVELAHQYERSRRDEEALALLDRAGGSPRADLIRSRILNRCGETVAAVDLLKRMTKGLPREAELRLEGLGELALLHDKLGEYDEAFLLAREAKEEHLGRSSAEQAASHHVITRFAQMVDEVTPDDFERWRGEFDPPGDEPRPALLTGFPRSGTTLLEQVLDAHPEVVSLEERDLLAREILPAMHGDKSAKAPLLAVLDGLGSEEITGHRRFMWRAFEAMGRQSLKGKCHLDKNPAYNLLIPFYLRLFPETRILVALRDPRDVLISCYLRYLPLNPISVTFLTLQSTAHRYALDMTAWLKFSTMIPDQWVEVRYEDLIHDLEGGARQVCDALELPWDSRMLDYRQRLAEKRVNSPTYADVARPLYSSSIGRWKNYRKHLEASFEPLRPFLEAFEYS